MEPFKKKTTLELLKEAEEQAVADSVKAFKQNQSRYMYQHASKGLCILVYPEPEKLSSTSFALIQLMPGAEGTDGISRFPDSLQPLLLEALKSKGLLPKNLYHPSPWMLTKVDSPK